MSAARTQLRAWSPFRRTASGRHVERVALLSGVLAGSPARAARLAQDGLARARSRGSVTDDDLLRELAALAAQLPDAEEALGRLLLLLVDLEGRPVAALAPVLGLSPAEAQVRLEETRRRAGTGPRGAACRGWGLAAGGERLTPAERQAAEGHLQLCRRCRERLSAQERTRRELLGAAAGTALLAAGAAAAGGGTAAAAGGTLLAGKAVTALVAGLGAAVMVGGGVAAVLQSSADTPAGRPAVQAPVGSAPAVAPTASGVSGTPACASGCPATSPATSPASSPATVPAPATAEPAPTAAATAAAPDPLVPSLPLPAIPSIPVLPLPSVSPVPLPTPSVLPLPSVPPLPSLPTLLPGLP